MEKTAHFPCSLSKHSFYQEIQGLTPFVTELSCWCFEQRMRRKDLVCKHKHLFPWFVCCIFPGNNRIIRLCTSVMLSATSTPPHPSIIALIQPKLFQYILSNTLWVIVVVDTAGQISKQEKVLKLFRSSETGWWKTRREEKRKESRCLFW